MKTPTLPNPLQFGVRHLLVAMLIAAGTAALFAPAIRRWSAGQWSVLLIHLAAVGGGCGLMLVIHHRRRSRILAEAGALLWEVPITTRGRDQKRAANSQFHAMLALLAAAAIFEFVVLQVLGYEDWRQAYGPVAMYGAIVGLLGGVAICQQTFPPRVLYIAEEGVVYSTLVVGWKEVQWFYDARLDPPQIVVKLPRYTCDLFPADAERWGLASFLNDHAYSWLQDRQNDVGEVGAKFRS